MWSDGGGKATAARRPLFGHDQVLNFLMGLHRIAQTADDASLRVLQDSFETLPNAMTEIHLQHLGGAVGQMPADATAFALRDQEFIVNVIARTPNAVGFAKVVEWARGVTSGLGPDAGTYVNFSGDADAALVRASYPPDTYRRLVELKNEYDPANLFRLNQNIAPSA